MSELKTNKISTNDQNNVAIDNALGLKSYNTTDRDALTSVAGDMIYNTTDSKVQVHNGSAWGNLGAIDPFSVEYLVIAGGGGGDNSGAGAGGYRSNVSGENSGGGASAETSMTLGGDINYTITVGAGGSGGVDGNDSQFQGVISYRGAQGTGVNEAFGNVGGSGSGGCHVSGGGTRYGGPGIPTQGFKGGTKTGDTYPFKGAGGGGAGAVGANGTGSGSSGGAGVDSSITGSSVGRAGGGSTNTAAVVDGGGNGSTNATANTGGGGGNGRSGGSGVVILRWATADATIGATRTGLTDGGVQTDGSDSYIVFTGGTGTISFS